MVHFVVSGGTLLASEAVLRDVALGPITVVTESSALAPRVKAG